MIFKPFLLLSLAASILALDPVEVKGNALYVKDSSSRFYIRGVDYQPGGSSNLEDPLADPKTCERDIPAFKDLGINTVRVYSFDNTADHDECMSQLADAGIYVLLDVNIPEASISRSDASCSYNTMYLEEVFASVNAMAKYDNTLGFFAGNEVINDKPSSSAAPYVKAVVRDMKNFIKNTGLRAIPVGYSAADVDELRLQTAEYFNCGDDEMARVDMFGFNDYSWCGDSSFTTSGYDNKVQQFQNYTVPLFFSEFGCNRVSPRPFTEVAALYSTKMSAVFSGGLVYEYSEETSNYGLVEIDGDSVTKNDDFANLKKAYAATSNPSGDGGAKSSGGASQCPKQSDNWNTTVDLPDTPFAAQRYIDGKATPKGNGFKASTQWACTMENQLTAEAKNATDSSISSISSTRSSGTSSSASSSSASASASSSKKSEAYRLDAESFKWVHGLGFAGVIVGLTLI